MPTSQNQEIPFAVLEQPTLDAYIQHQKLYFLYKTTNFYFRSVLRFYYDTYFNYLITFDKQPSF